MTSSNNANGNPPVVVPAIASVNKPVLPAPTRPKGMVGKWLPLIILLVLSPALYYGGQLVWIRVIHDYFYPRNFGVVEPGRIFRSGLISHHIIQKTLVQNRIRLVIYMSGDDPRSGDAEFERIFCSQMGIRRLNFNLDGNGTGNVSNYIDALTELVAADERGIPVLVHCKTGAQRTGGMIAFYRVLVEGKSGKQAYAELLQYGHDPSKNPHLVPYLNQHMREVAIELVDKGAIGRVPDPLPVIEP